MLLEHVQQTQGHSSDFGDPRQIGRGGWEAERGADRATFRLRRGEREGGKVDEVAEVAGAGVGTVRRAVLVLRCQVRSVRVDTFHLPLGAVLLPQEPQEAIEGRRRRSSFLPPALLRGARVQRVVHPRDHPSMLGTLLCDWIGFDKF